MFTGGAGRHLLSERCYNIVVACDIERLLFHLSIFFNKVKSVTLYKTKHRNKVGSTSKIITFGLQVTRDYKDINSHSIDTSLITH